MPRRNISIIIVLLTALILIIFVIWLFDRRIKKISKNGEASSVLRSGIHINRGNDKIFSCERIKSIVQNKNC